MTTDKRDLAQKFWDFVDTNVVSVYNGELHQDLMDAIERVNASAKETYRIVNEAAVRGKSPGMDLKKFQHTFKEALDEFERKFPDRDLSPGDREAMKEVMVTLEDIAAHIQNSIDHGATSGQLPAVRKQEQKMAEEVKGKLKDLPKCLDTLNKKTLMSVSEALSHVFEKMCNACTRLKESVSGLSLQGIKDKFTGGKPEVSSGPKLGGSEKD